MLNFLAQSFSNLLHLVFPKNCALCSTETPDAKHALCAICESELNYGMLDFESESNRVNQLFWGRTSIDHCFSLLNYSKNQKSADLLHALKYQNTPQIGTHFGLCIDAALNNSPTYKTIDCFVPVPLHPKKKFERGYNQSLEIAKGITQHTDKPIDTKLIKRLKHKPSQTTLNRFERWNNIQNTYTLSGQLKGNEHICLVDDVVTTGSTIEAIAQEIRKKYPKVTISLITLAAA